MFHRAKRTLALADLFRSCNGSLSYDAIETAMGETIADLRPTIANVRKYLERDEGIVFATVRGEGYRRLTDAEKVASAATFRHKIRRTAVSGARRIDAVSDMAALDNATQLAATLERTIFETIQRETGERQ